MHTVVFTDATVISGFVPTASEMVAQQHTALAIREGVVVALGDMALALVGSPNTEVRFLNGSTVLPGIGDGHAHPTFAGAEMLGPQIRACTSVAEIAARVAEFVDAHPEAAWIVGGSYDSTLTPDGLFDAAWLDHIDRPVVLNCQDYHTYWVNSAALRAAGITAETPEPPLGRIIRRQDGSPVGTLQEYGALDLVRAVMPRQSLDFRVECIDLATRHYAELGVTWVQDAWVEPDDVAGYIEAAGRGSLHIRVNLALKAEPNSWRTQIDGFNRSRASVQKLDHPNLSCTSIKFFVDGVVENYTADMLSPYSDSPTGDTGIANWTFDELLAAALAVDSAGFQLHLHAIGDAANRRALDVISEVQRINGPRDRRPVIAHIHVLSPADTERFADLGVVANFEPYWAQLDDVMVDQTAPRLGPERATHQYRIADVVHSGAVVSFGSDWPVTTADWRPAVEVAVTRETVDRVPDGGWLPEQRVSVETALHAYTWGNAFQSLDDSWGTLVVGSRADFVVLDGNPCTTAPHDIPNIRVLETWIGGKHVWNSRNFPPHQGI